MSDNNSKLHAYSDYAWLRGFSVIPSWGARIEEAWWFYSRDKMIEELAPARLMHANCIRLWIEFSAWMADPAKVQADFMDAIDCIDKAGMKAMPVLFNRWHDRDFDYGGTYVDNLYRNWDPMLDYVGKLVSPLKGDDRVLMWDLCNEPQAFDLESDVNRREFRWLEKIADAARSAGVRQPITIGCMSGANVDVFAPLCDVLCGHPYAHRPADLDAMITDFQAQARKYGRPLVANETIPGALDDLIRAEVCRWYTQRLEQAGFGWMGWALREGKAISTRRDRFDQNGILQQGFHPFATRSGALRDGLEFLTRPPSIPVPWKR